MVVLVHHHHHKPHYSPESNNININNVVTRKSKPAHLHLIILLLLSLFSFTLAFLLFPPPSLLHFIPNNNNSSISCDRRTDVCCLTGYLISTHSNSNTIAHLPSNNDNLTPPSSDEKIRPYPRKWETSIMSQIPQLRLCRTRKQEQEQETPCDVLHNVPAVVFLTGGYTGNVFHEFNEGIIPLYITSHHFRKNVTFVILQYKNWWVSKYRDVLSRLSGFQPIDFYNDTRTHCFREAVVGLSIHDDLSIDSEKMGNNDSIRGFRKMLDEAYRPRIRSIELEEEDKNVTKCAEVQNPKLVVLSRIGSRAIENEEGMVNLAEEIGFRVKVLRPDRTTELAKIYRELNSSEVMIAVHGAAMTHFLFMRPGSVFIQIVPLGTDWAAETYYGEPAVRMGLWYLAYKIRPAESSLYKKYGEDDPVLRDPEDVNAKGWEATKRVYLERQNVILDLERFRVQVERAYWYLVSKRRLN